MDQDSTKSRKIVPIKKQKVKKFKEYTLNPGKSYTTTLWE